MVLQTFSANDYMENFRVSKELETFTYRISLVKGRGYYKSRGQI